MDPNFRKEDSNDLGFGSRVARAARLRLLNRDGSFNVRRRGLSPFERLSIYHALITMPWWLFLLAAIAAFLAFNALFAAAYLLCGDGAVHGMRADTGVERFLEAFFFSVETSTTIGSLHMEPGNVTAGFLASFEVMFGLLGFAVVTGVLFARVSRPGASIIFSRQAVIAPYQDKTGLMFRIANRRKSELLEVSVSVTLSRLQGEGEARRRRFYQLPLERESVLLFPLNWTIVHPIDRQSPLYGISPKDLQAADTELLVYLTALDETFSQKVHARTSYKADELVWGARFTDILQSSRGGRIAVDLRRIHDTEPAPLPG